MFMWTRGSRYAVEYNGTVPLAVDVFIVGGGGGGGSDQGGGGGGGGVVQVSLNVTGYVTFSAWIGAGGSGGGGFCGLVGCNGAQSSFGDYVAYGGGGGAGGLNNPTNGKPASRGATGGGGVSARLTFALPQQYSGLTQGYAGGSGKIATDTAGGASGGGGGAGSEGTSEFEVNVAGSGGAGLAPGLGGLMADIYGNTPFGGGGGGGATSAPGASATAGLGGVGGGGKGAKVNGATGLVGGINTGGGGGGDVYCHPQSDPGWAGSQPRLQDHRVLGAAGQLGRRGDRRAQAGGG